MTHGKRVQAVVVGLGLLVSAAAAQSAPEGDLDTRVSRLERLLDSQSLVDMLTRLEQLQQEVQELRGQVEEQNHLIDGLKRRQRELYLDVDRRLSRVEREGGGPADGQPAPQPDAAATPAQTESPASLADERRAYEKAFDLLRELRYGPAIEAFGQFLQKYPNGRYGHIAQYWLGEANYAQRNFKQAIVDYQKLLDNYPKSPKLAEAMLKIGYSHYELGQRDEATKVLHQLIKRYPDTTAAGQAQNLLQKIRRAS